MNWLKSGVVKLNKLPDHILVYQAKRGNRAAFGKLYLKYLDQIYRYIFFRIGQNRQLAEDMVETVFFRAWAKLSEYQQNGNFSSWLYRIAHNLVIDHFRKKSEANLKEDLPAPDDLEQDLILKDNVNGLRDAMNQLTDMQKQVVTLKFIEELNNREIAGILGKKEDAIRAIQFRALKKLRHLLQNYA